MHSCCSWPYIVDINTLHVIHGVDMCVFPLYVPESMRLMQDAIRFHVEQPPVQISFNGLLSTVPFVVFV